VPLSDRPLRETFLGSQPVQAIRRAATDDGHLTRIDETKVAIVDPLFADWLRRSFP
jgi:hypothetical protein